MDNEKNREYTARISQANRSELVVIIFELFMYSIDEAEELFNEEKKDEAVRYMRKAQDCVAQLRRSLNFDYEIAYNLSDLYKYVHRLIVPSIIKGESADFSSIREVMGGLAEAFEEIAKDDKSATVMKNSQQVYAGLTYGKGKLNEVLMNANESTRGFKA